MKSYDVAILGGGITGLAAAYFLSKAGKKVVVVEKGSKLGGVLKMTSHESNGVKYEIEEFYHHVLAGDTDMIKLMGELNMQNELEWHYPQTAFWRQGRLYRLSGMLDLPKFRILSLANKLSLAKLMVVVKLAREPSRFDSITAEEFVARYGSKNLWAKLFRSLLYSKFGSKCNEISGAWLVERLKIRSHMQSYAKGGGERIGYFKEGFRQVWNKLAQEARKQGAEFLFNSPVKKIRLANNAVKEVVAGKKKIACNWIISTIPINLLGAMVKLPPEYLKRIGRIEYQGVVCVTLGLSKGLNEKYYWINLVVELPLRLGAVLEHTNFIPAERYGGDTILFLASYPEYSQPVWNWTDEKVFEEYLSDLQKIFSDVSRKDVRWWHVARERHAGIVYKKGILKDIPPYQTPVKGLLVAGMFNNYPERSTSISVRMGRELTAMIAGKNSNF